VKRFPLTIIAVVLLAVSQVQADSPLSALGYGLYQSASGARDYGVGTATLATPDSLTVSPYVPATWGGYPHARFGVNLKWDRNRAEDAFGSELSDLAGFDGAALVLPLGKEVYGGLSLAPITRMHYKIRAGGNAGWSPAGFQREGQGGISQTLAAASFQAPNAIRVGVGVRLITGKIERLSRVDYTGAPTGTIPASFTFSDRYRGVGGHLSAFRDVGNWTAAIAIDSPVELDIERQLVVKNGSAVQSDSTSKRPYKAYLPWGLAFGYGRRWGGHTVAASMALQLWGSTDAEPQFDRAFSDGRKYAVGWEWKPDFRPLDPFYRGLIYRAGVYRAEDYALTSGGWQAVRHVATGGVGIPFAGGRSRLDLAVEGGIGGADRSDSVRERFLTLKVSFHHAELWFVQRKGRH